MSDPKTVVLVHGAWHGAWCWEKVLPLLARAGVAASAVDLPLTSLGDDAQATRDAIDAVDGAVVLCGHSYGGAVITEAGHHPKVEHLLYLTAFACDEGESPAATAVGADLPSTDVAEVLEFDDSQTIVTLRPQGTVQAFYDDCDRDDVDAALARLRPIHFECLTTPLGPPAWRVKPATYVVCTNDRAIHPALQRHMAARCKATVEWLTAHSPFLNRPDLVADLLVDLATE